MEPRLDDGNYVEDYADEPAAAAPAPGPAPKDGESSDIAPHRLESAAQAPRSRHKAMRCDARRSSRRRAAPLLLRGLAAAALVAASSGVCSRGAVPEPPCANCDWEPDAPCRTATPQGIAHGTNCNARCQVGFSSAGAHTETYTCSNQQLAAVPGQPALNCVTPSTRSFCASTPPCEADNCEWDAACQNPGKLPTSKCTAVCRPGWYSTKDYDSSPYSCKIVGRQYSWTPDHNHHDLKCQKYCPDVPPYAHQRWRGSGEEDYDCLGHLHKTEEMAPDDEHGTYWCKSSCEPGYEWRNLAGDMKFCNGDYDSESKGANENDHDVGWYICQADGTWQPEHTPVCTCKPKVCPQQTVAAGPRAVGWATTECEEGHFGDQGCEINCAGGFVQGLLECKAECTAMLPVKHSEENACVKQNREALTEHNRTLPVSGETCYGDCAPPYVESNSAVYTCADNGHWVRDGGGAVAFGCVAEEHAQQCLGDADLGKTMHFHQKEEVSTCNLTASRDTGCRAECAEGFQPDCRVTVLTDASENDDECDPYFICDAQGRWVSKIPSRGLFCTAIPTACRAGRGLATDADGRVKCTVCHKAGDSRPECQRPSDSWWFLLLLWIPASYAFACILCPGCLPSCLAPRRPGSKPSVLRETFLGDIPLPGAQLAEQDVASRWMAAEQLRHQDADDSDDEENYSNERHTAPGALDAGSGVGLFSSFSMGRRRHKANGSSQRPLSVMFTGDHVGELQPWHWQTNPLGTGSYGIVYKAQWRGRDVAVKVLKLPQRGVVMTTSGEKKLKAQVESVMQDFIDEVEVCCDLNHPNLARLLGYAEKPSLMMVQELLYNACDHLLYVEHWQPTTKEVLKAALDVAKGMAYLHTSFSMPDSTHTQPIMHRDLKTPNLLLASNPCAPGGTVNMKITDFGLSRDKGLSDTFNQTVAMTGCGSVLWMAPEILTGETYNEKVDVFSFAMCLVELVGCTLPWRGLCAGGPAEVPHRVTRGERPDAQLNSLDSGGAVGLGLKQLIDDCWHHFADQRPAFPEVVARVRELRRMEAAGSTGGGAGDSGGGGEVGRVSHPPRPPIGRLSVGDTERVDAIASRFANANWTTAGGVAAPAAEQEGEGGGSRPAGTEAGVGAAGGSGGGGSERLRGSRAVPPVRKKKLKPGGYSALPDVPELGGAE